MKSNTIFAGNCSPADLRTRDDGSQQLGAPYCTYVQLVVSRHVTWKRDMCVLSSTTNHLKSCIEQKMPFPALNRFNVALTMLICCRWSERVNNISYQVL